MEMLEFELRFTDEKGTVKDEEFLVRNKNQLESLADMIADDLKKRWNSQHVKWEIIKSPFGGDF